MYFTLFFILQCLVAADSKLESPSSPPLARICNPCYDIKARIATNCKPPKRDKFAPADSQHKTRATISYNVPHRY